MTLSKKLSNLIASSIILGSFFMFSQSAQGMKLSLNLLGTHETGIFDEGSAEIPAYDPLSGRVFVVNGFANELTVLDINNPRNPIALSPISLTGGGVNSVAVKNGVVAVAEQATIKTDPGMVSFYNTDGLFLNSVMVGALPDMLDFTPDGSKILVANEGEPNDDYTIDPEGSVSIIDISGGIGSLSQSNVITAGFQAFNNSRQQLIDAGVRIFGPDADNLTDPDAIATVARDLEPEYIAISEDSTTAWVALQENNALGVLDINSGTFTNIIPLGFKDYSLDGNSLDASNEDGTINLQTYDNLFGMYQPDAIATYTVNGQTYIVTANEGDSRDYDGFSEEARVADVVLDPDAFPNATELQQDSVLGRLNITTTLGDIDNDGDFDELYSYGARSFSIWDDEGNLVFDSGNQFEVLLAQLLPEYFNASNDNNTFDNRSDDKGPEPEAVTIGRIGDQIYAFIGLERIGGIMIYNITDPENPSFVNYTNNRNFTEDVMTSAAGDLGPEGVVFINPEDSPTNSPLLVVANEISGTTSVYGISKVPEPNAILGLMTVGLMGSFRLLKHRKKSN
ncbi:alkaline phosphatase [Crocosphaera subtropica ATCC 51142]|uniref:Alkaline phosphatase n=1 Tax=Crocosphaera subtropica (strain ATCC 51142 / BH68) TaxID=43989 RepID=B1WW31_CROS5|nr:choice-of-anchor I family protein [Crocosphaera subtropica]ACB52364.1 alkaline phosphatase [Crocosphaera subtropica ATCC 51142]